MTPRHVAVLHPGGLGDLVLTSGLVEALKEAAGRVTLYCRPAVAGAAALMPAAPDTAPIPVDPYRYGEATPEVAAKLADWAGELRQSGVDYVVAAAFRPTWLTEFVAAATGATTLVHTEPEGRPMARRLIQDLGLAPGPLTTLPQRHYGHELERYQALAEAVTGSSAHSGPPRFLLLPAHREAALTWLLERRLPAGGYVACFPGGNPATPVKRWPAARYAELLRQCLPARTPVLLVGEQQERGELETLAAALPSGAAVFAGQESELGLLAGLLAFSRCWIGNDTGPAHLAQAYRRPGIVLFGGGGGWPAYAPWAPDTVGLVHPLPCFGCRWECPFETARCLDLVTVAEASVALRQVLLSDDTARLPARVRTLDSLPEAELDRIGAVGRGFAALRSALRAREEDIAGLRRELAVQSAVAAERKQALERLSGEVHGPGMTAPRRAAEAERSAAEIAALHAHRTMDAAGFRAENDGLLEVARLIESEAERRGALLDRAAADQAAAVADRTARFEEWRLREEEISAEAGRRQELSERSAAAHAAAEAARISESAASGQIVAELRSGLEHANAEAAAASAARVADWCAGEASRSAAEQHAEWRLELLERATAEFAAVQAERAADDVAFAERLAGQRAAMAILQSEADKRGQLLERVSAEASAAAAHGIANQCAAQAQREGVEQHARWRLHLLERATADLAAEQALRASDAAACLEQAERQRAAAEHLQASAEERGRLLERASAEASAAVAAGVMDRCAALAEREGVEHHARWRLNLLERATAELAAEQALRAAGSAAYEERAEHQRAVAERLQAGLEERVYLFERASAEASAALAAGVVDRCAALQEREGVEQHARWRLDLERAAADLAAEQALRAADSAAYRGHAEYQRARAERLPVGRGHLFERTSAEAGVVRLAASWEPAGHTAVEEPASPERGARKPPGEDGMLTQLADPIEKMRAAIEERDERIQSLNDRIAGLAIAAQHRQRGLTETVETLFHLLKQF